MRNRAKIVVGTTVAGRVVTTLGNFFRFQSFLNYVKHVVSMGCVLNTCAYIHVRVFGITREQMQGLNVRLSLAPTACNVLTFSPMCATSERMKRMSFLLRFARVAERIGRELFQIGSSGSAGGGCFFSTLDQPQDPDNPHTRAYYRFWK